MTSDRDYLARTLYEAAWRASLEGSLLTIEDWEKLDEKIRNRWRAAADAALEWMERWESYHGDPTYIRQLLNEGDQATT